MQAGVMLDGTAFEPGAMGNMSRAQKYDYRRRTDEQGAFSFDPKPGAHTVVAVGPEGLGRTRCFDTSRPLEIQLQAWGRIEGVVRKRDGQWADRELLWQGPGNLTSWMTLFYGKISARSDATGQFTLEHVPPSDGRVVIADDKGSPSILSAAVRIDPGATVQVQVGGVGRMILGRLIAPPNVEIRSWSNQVNHASLRNEYEPYPLPKTLKGNDVERWKLEYEESESGRVWLRESRCYDFSVGADGSFSIPEVLPGRYRLFISVAQGSLGSGLDRTVRNPDDPQTAWGGMKVTVNGDPKDSGSPMDLGDVELTATR